MEFGDFKWELDKSIRVFFEESGGSQELEKEQNKELYNEVGRESLEISFWKEKISLCYININY